MKQNRKKPTPVMNHRASCFKNHLAQAVVDQMQGSAKITWYFLSPNGLQFGRKTASLNSMGTHKSLQEFFFSASTCWPEEHSGFGGQHGQSWGAEPTREQQQVGTMLHPHCPTLLAAPSSCNHRHRVTFCHCCPHHHHLLPCY